MLYELPVPLCHSPFPPSLYRLLQAAAAAPGQRSPALHSLTWRNSPSTGLLHRSSIVFIPSTLSWPTPSNIIKTSVSTLFYNCCNVHKQTRQRIGRKRKISQLFGQHKFAIQNESNRTAYSSIVPCFVPRFVPRFVKHLSHILAHISSHV